ncbi:hypothetical protein [Halosegnis longus]|uniref:hypothetical protein n=1 Tax=Halosegnis longus TaxID=2216012 RepID=UPI00129ED15D|nr:hypothetical protein [Halosegnis longus]
MPELILDGPQIAALQQLLENAGYEAPKKSEIVDEEKYIEDTGDPEGYKHHVAEPMALWKILNACPVCGDPKCQRGVSYVGTNMLHADKHPENQRVRREPAVNRRKEPNISRPEDLR